MDHVASTDAGTTAATPAGAVQQFAERLSAGDLEGALAFYEPQSSIAPEPGRVVHGLDAIREALKGFIALSPALRGDIVWVQETGDTALVLNDWTLVGRDPDGNDVRMAGRAADVLRRGADGRWRYVIDCPWGGA